MTASKSINSMTADEIRQAVRENYANAAHSDSACGCNKSTCCKAADEPARTASASIGYSADELAAIPEGADLGLGCGNPTAIASLKPGQVVLDLGSGAGIDCFLAARKVAPGGTGGRVIGVDMTAEMIRKARANAARENIGNVEFRLGEVEHLPVADESIDVIISNCVINLSPDKPQVYREMYRVLKPWGRIAISDVVALGPLPDALQQSIEMLTGCVSGASPVDQLRRELAAAGFRDISIRVSGKSRQLIREWAPGSGIERYVTSAIIEARKTS